MSTLTGDLMNTLERFTVKDRADKYDDNPLECDACGKVLCTVEGDDTLRVLVSVAIDHLAECPGERNDEEEEL